MASLKIFLFLCFFSQILATNENDLRIINGEVSNESQFPFAVAFFYTTTDGRFFCGGSLISERWVLTAAHCLEGAIEISVYLGTNNLEHANTTGLIVNTTEYIIHPEFESKFLKNDVGLVFLQRSVDFSGTIQPVVLPTEPLGAQEEAIALGWGALTDEQMLPTNLLHHVTLTTISNALCRRTYGEFIQENMVCLIGEENEGICYGDRGGPLVQINSENKNVQVGVASFYSGNGCETEHPSGYTRTFEYVEWIRSAIEAENVTVVTEETESTKVTEEITGVTEETESTKVTEHPEITGVTEETETTEAEDTGRPEEDAPGSAPLARCFLLLTGFSFLVLFL